MSTTELSPAEGGQAFTAADFHSGTEPIWCPGCGDYGVLSALQRALAAYGRPPHEIVVVSGVGCSSRLPAYLSCYGFHGVHGRGVAFASGVKLARPELEVIAVGGDGDGFSIGTNHFIHACRRNLDMLYLVMDNRVYGMTKGQPSPTTEPDWDSAMVPGGSELEPLVPLGLAISAGANFVARGFAGHPEDLADLIVAGLRFPGFAFVQVLSPCVSFRAEEFIWRHGVHPVERTIENDRAAAHAALLEDDGMTLGILFKDTRSALPKHAAPPPASLADIEMAFAAAPPPAAGNSKTGG